MGKNSSVDYFEFANDLAKETLTDMLYYEESSEVDKRYLKDSFSVEQVKREIKAIEDFEAYCGEDSIVEKHVFAMIFKLGIRIGALYAS